ncbi:DUF4386 family protein [Deinococcus cellulosilyticus]|uniref:DUF4386 family protein n=1 Tax=Deinococcus cellulosilyticus (strain DSM 18568 / NBRC 106333 / KACC 11606 / 5516J-15) TaxID=1223518 RepID=A0A511N3R3_DEIC1|nr:DUF4386 family protein [Deinococcus cellulosilyticus]GEM47108.1 hypothetical protein DC3_27430 [Deinococcus cellulosilyticus NBRC 106333 = KACC 11606]
MQNAQRQGLQRTGGIAALTNGVAYIVGLGLALTLLAPVFAAGPKEYLAFMKNNLWLIYSWNLLIYMIAGITMVPLALAMHERLKDNQPALMQVATAFGLIWAMTIISSGMIILNDIEVVSRLHSQDPERALTVWMSVETIERGLGGALEIPGGIWTLMVSWVGWQTRKLPRALGALGMLVGGAGILTLWPFQDEAGTVFGLGMVVWFLWVGILLMRRPALRQQVALN